MNLLITSVGRRTYLVKYFQEALAGFGHLHVSNSLETLATQITQNKLITPNIYDDQYISTLLAYCQEHQITHLMSLFDIDLLILAKNQNRFSTLGTKVILASYKSIEACNDKWKTHILLQSIGILSPPTYLTIDSALKAVQSGTLSFPLIIKPRWGMGSIGINFAHNEGELRSLYSVTRRACFESYLKDESSTTSDFPIIIQQVLHGQEHGIDIINDFERNYRSCIAKSKLSMRSGETDIGQIVDPEPFKTLSRKISERIQHQGLLSADCFVTQTGLYVTELNCRFSGHYPVSHMAGANVPLFIVHQALGMSTSDSLLQSQIGVRVMKDIVPKTL